MRNNREYVICKDIALYLRLQYPNVLFHFDLAGLNLSMAQAGMNKAIQGGRGWPDLFIAQPSKGRSGLFIEVKKEGTKIYNTKGSPATPHIAEQIQMHNRLTHRGYESVFAIGFDEAKLLIDIYLR
jgi:hypothetical protein